MITWIDETATTKKAVVTCPICGAETVIEHLPIEGVNLYRRVASLILGLGGSEEGLLKNAFPSMTPQERETMMSGRCFKCQPTIVHLTSIVWNDKINDKEYAPMIVKIVKQLGLLDVEGCDLKTLKEIDNEEKVTELVKQYVGNMYGKKYADCVVGAEYSILK